MVESPSGVAVSAPRHALGQEFYLLAFARNAQHGTNRGLGREHFGRGERGPLPWKPIGACNAAKVRLGKYARICP